MSRLAVISAEALRQIVREALGFASMSPDPVAPSDYSPVAAALFEPEGPVEVCDVVDDQAAQVDPSNPNYTPQNDRELGVAVKELVAGTPDEFASQTYSVLRRALADAQEKNGVQSTTGDGKEKPRHHGDDEMKNEARDLVRTAVRSIIRESGALNELEFDDALSRQRAAKDADEPATAAEVEPDDEAATAAGDLALDDESGTEAHDDLALDGDELDLDGDADDVSDDEPGTDVVPGDDEDLDAATAGEDMGRTRAAPFDISHLNKKGDESGKKARTGEASFTDIATEMGMSVAGAKQAVDKALARAQFLAPADKLKKYGMEPDDLEIAVLEALQDYIEHLEVQAERNGEPLTDEEKKLLRANPEIIIGDPTKRFSPAYAAGHDEDDEGNPVSRAGYAQGTPGFRYFLSKYVRKMANRAGIDLDKPFAYGESDVVGGRKKKKDDEDEKGEKPGENWNPDILRIAGVDKDDVQPRAKGKVTSLTPDAKDQINALLAKGVSLSDALKQVADRVEKDVDLSAPKSMHWKNQQNPAKKQAPKLPGRNEDPFGAAPKKKHEEPEDDEPSTAKDDGGEDEEPSTSKD